MTATELITALQQLPADYRILVWNPLTEKYEPPVLDVKPGIDMVLIEPETIAALQKGVGSR